MSSYLLGMICVLADICLNAFGQLCFKQASEHPAGVHPIALIQHCWRNKWILLGAVCFFTEVGVWTGALRMLPLSVAFPIGSLCFVLVALFSRLILKERVSISRWIGVALILIGVALIGLPGKPETTPTLQAQNPKLQSPSPGETQIHMKDQIGRS